MRSLTAAWLLLAPSASMTQQEEDLYDVERQAVQSAERSRQADANFEALMTLQGAPVQLRAVSQAGELGPGVKSKASHVEVSLSEFHRVRDRLRRLRDDAARNLGPAVVLGAAEYTGEARQGALSLTLNLQITLGHPGRWKVVPLVGDDAVVTRVRAAGSQIPVARRNGYHVWVTDRTGEVTLTIDLLVPARGPRGSIEYDFLVARTPVTRFSCRFPVAGLEPRLTAAVHSEVTSSGTSTLYTATLLPTTRIHLVGFRDLGAAEERDARIYAETTSLLSVDEGTLDLFTVVRYTILYAGTKDFAVEIPEGMTVVSADGKGAFQFTVEKGDRPAVLRGETAFPIRNNYEISLRLRQELSDQSFDLRLPRCLGVEREQGWLGVEVTGKLKLEELERRELLAVDIRQLPVEMLQGAVSPILKAYRYNLADAGVRLAATRLPEKEPESASVDRVRAFTVVSTDGQVLTDLRITLRNRLRHSLSLTLPAATVVRTSLLGGEPVKPSRTNEGHLIVALKRSAGDDRLEPFTIQIVLAGSVPSLGILGHRELELPAVDLPVSSLGWTIYLPARNIYTAPASDVEPQDFVGTASWHQPVHRRPVTAVRRSGDLTNAMAATGSRVTGAMPVRIKLPERGRRVEHNRYWLDAGKRLTVSVWYLRGWVRLPMGLALVVALAASLVWLSRRWQAGLRAAWPGLAVAVALLVPVQKLAGIRGLAVAALLAALVVAWRLGWLSGLGQRIRSWITGMPERFSAREKLEWRVGLVFWRLMVGSGLLLFGIALLVSVVELISLLLTPLPG
jgi:hypothetical protein